MSSLYYYNSTYHAMNNHQSQHRTATCLVVTSIAFSCTYSIAFVGLLADRYQQDPAKQEARNQLQQIVLPSPYPWRCCCGKLILRKPRHYMLHQKIRTRSTKQVKHLALCMMTSPTPTGRRRPRTCTATEATSALEVL